MTGLPKLSIAAKLYAIFGMLATVTAALAGVTAINAGRHAALTAEFQIVLSRDLTAFTRSNATTVKGVADGLGTVATRIRAQVDAFFQKLRAA